MPAHICTTCGTQYPPADKPPAAPAPSAPEHAAIRQPARPGLDHDAGPGDAPTATAFAEHEPGLLGIGTVPGFAIGQRALLLRTAGRQRALGLHQLH